MQAQSRLNGRTEQELVRKLASSPKSTEQCAVRNGTREDAGKDEAGLFGQHFGAILIQGAAYCEP